MSNPCYDGCDDAQAQLYRPQDSTTYVNLTKPFYISYAVGAASGDLVSDVVSFAGYTLNQTFGALHHSASVYQSDSGVTGVLGLAWGKIGKLIKATFIDAIFIT